jgi:hypothetical protein
MKSPDCILVSVRWLHPGKSLFAFSRGRRGRLAIRWIINSAWVFVKKRGKYKFFA